MRVTSVTPVRDTEVALACSEVQRREGVVVDPIKARPNSSPVTPKAGPVAPPKTAVKPVAPKVMTLTCTPVVVSLSAVPAVSAASLTVTAELLRWKAKLPLKRKKSPATTLAPVKATSCRPTAMAPNW